MAKEKGLNIQIDVDIIYEKSKKSAEKNSGDQGIQKNLEKLHSRKNYHDSNKGSSKSTSPNIISSPKENIRLIS
jgi:hypothetical protein